MLRRRIRAAERCAHDAGDARHVDDRAVASLPPCRQYGADDTEGTGHVGVELTGEQVVVDHLDGAGHLETCVVDHDVEFVRIGDRGGDRRRIAHVERADLDRQVLGCGSLAERLTLREVAHRGDDLVALAGEAERSEFAESAVAPGDENACHVASLRSNETRVRPRVSWWWRSRGVRVRGSCRRRCGGVARATIVTAVGTLKLARRSPTNRCSSPASSVAPGLTITWQASSSPRRSCGMPYTAASYTAGCS